MFDFYDDYDHYDHYDHSDHYDQYTNCGSIFQWTIINAANRLDRWEHSFHIHQNSFQVVSQDLGEVGQVVVEAMEPGEWRDTVQIPVRGR